MHVQTIAKVTNREYEMIKCFSGTGDFEAVGMAKEFLRNQGYKIGSMCQDEPITASKKAKYIAKWRNIEIEDWPKIEAVMISENFRNGPSVFVYEFKEKV
jgi:hypothetical protein